MATTDLDDVGQAAKAHGDCSDQHDDKSCIGCCFFDIYQYHSLKFS